MHLGLDLLLKQWLGPLFGGDAPTAPPPVVGDGEDGPGERKPELPEKLRRLLVDRERVSAGRIRFIGLDAVRDRLGDRWPRARTVIETLAESIIDARLSDDDAFARISDVSFVLVFASADEATASAICLEIAERIDRRLFGDAAQQPLKALVSVTTLDGRSLLESDDPLAQMRMTLDDAEAAAAAATELAPPQPRTARLSCAFMPLWSVKVELIATYLCLPILTLPDGHRVVHHAGGDCRAWAEEMTPLDLAAVRRTVRELARGERMLLGTSVHARTLERRDSRDAFLTALEEVRDAAQRRCLVEVIGLDDTVPETRIGAVVGSIANHCRRVVLRLPFGSRRLLRAPPPGVAAVGVYVGAVPPGQWNLPERLAGFAELAHHSGIRCYAHGNETEAACLAAAAAGFDLIDGPQIGGLTAAPAPARAFRLAGLSAPPGTTADSGSGG